jgi:flagellin
MSRINTNVQSLIATRVFNKNNSNLNVALGRLSTGLKINSGRDDPAGLIASESLRASKKALTAATDNARRADTIVAIAEGGLQEINSLLLELEDLVDRTANEAGLASAEVRANQLQVDAILQSINRLANTTTFGDTKLLAGGFAFSTSSVQASSIASVQVNAAKIPNNATRDVTVQVVTGSEFASVSAVGGDTGGELSAAATIQVTGNFGTELFSFASGATQTQIATAINSSSGLTGVSAVVSGPAVVFTSTTFGSKGLVTVDIINDAGSTGVTLTGNGRDTGVDGTFLINGQNAIVDGLNASVRSGSLSLDLILNQDLAQGNNSNTTTSFQITGGGAKFSIAPDVGLVGQETIGVQSVSTGSLGNASVGFLSGLGSGEGNDLASKNFANAQRVVRASIDQVSSLRGRIGAFQRNTIATAINSLLVTFENTAAAESAIRDADFAVETSNLTRAQILVNSSTSTLQLANAGPQNVLALLG